MQSESPIARFRSWAHRSKPGSPYYIYAVRAFPRYEELTDDPFADEAFQYARHLYAKGDVMLFQRKLDGGLTQYEAHRVSPRTLRIIDKEIV